MGVFIGAVVLNASNNRRAAAFWAEALGYVREPRNPDFLHPEEWSPPSATRQDHGPGAHVHLDRDDKMHLDLWVDQDSDVHTEVERLVSLGAKRVDWVYQDGAQHVVLADTEGNLFCLCA
ncbi:VOC family protein [Phytoactinopolyspora halotolerans]|uniref:VOC family protein n=1 Tax=Phytoactinopolyspora halotolerans TaxID=1981512 RepID=A0A6L9SFF1_9ACTN|nr:VOC family protein [Phytoactinopolyspora halotolerans]NEE03793.1 VOC family protein [Phytoactinopolyspora halotolerans]